MQRLLRNIPFLLPVIRRRSRLVVIDVPVDQLPDPEDPGYTDPAPPPPGGECYVVTAITDGVSKPTVVTGVTAEDTGSGVLVKWDKKTNATLYKVKKGWSTTPPASAPNESDPSDPACAEPNTQPHFEPLEEAEITLMAVNEVHDPFFSTVEFRQVVLRKDY